MAESDKERVEKLRDIAKEIVDNTKCGYCKEIFTDVYEVANKYLTVTDISDKLFEIEEQIKKRKEYMNKLEEGANKVYASAVRQLQPPVSAESQEVPEPRRGSGFLGLGFFNNEPIRQGPLRSFLSRRAAGTKEKFDKFFELKIL